jgi:glycosyltransferase involved in cell wall biosynthesis
MPSVELEAPVTPAAIRPERAARVTIALPTFNRAHMLARAIDSVRGQTYGYWELIISDNASTDGTQMVCERAAARDERITCIRQPVNLGGFGNFNFLSDVGRAPLFMYLADDDWLGESFLERCVAVLEARPDVVLACGALRVYEGERYVGEQPAHNLPQDLAVHRLLACYGSGASAWTYYGVRRRSAHRRAGPVPNYQASDKSEIAALAYLGKFVMVPDAYYHRVRASVDPLEIAQREGLPGLQGRHPTLTFACFAFADIGWRLDAYEALSRPARLGLGLAAMTVWLSNRLVRRRLLAPARRAKRRLRRLARPATRRVRRVRRRARSRARRLRHGIRRLGRRSRRRGLRLLVSLYAGARPVARRRVKHHSYDRTP